MLCAKCQSDNLPDAAFCTECGAKLEAMCPSCGLSNPPGSKFCRKCGSKLSTIGASAPGSRPHGDSVLLPASAMADVAEGERKMVTALFADIKGSTELMRDHDPEEARSVVDPVLHLMIAAVHRYGGYVAQSTGDGIFALFGAPIAHEDHPQRALYSAMRMQ